MKSKPIWLLALLAAAVALPLVFPNPFITNMAVLTVIFAAAATAWNIFAGYTGYIALGHAAFFGTGAYSLAIICQHWNVSAEYTPFMLLPLCGVIAAVLSLPLGLVALRTRGHTFIVITIAMFFIAQLLAYDLRGLTHGSAGLSLPIPLSWSGDFYNMPFYYVGLLILLVALAVSWWIRNSKYGLGLLAIRDDEDRALGLGVKTGPSKLLAFVLSAFFVGMLGALWAYYIEAIFPPFAFDALFDVAIALMAFMGGIGTLAGPILGALLLEPAQLWFAANFGQSGWYLVIYGALLLVVILLLPEGIVPTVRKRWAQWTAARARSSPTTPASVPPLPPPPAPQHPAIAARGEGGER